MGHLCSYQSTGLQPLWPFADKPMGWKSSAQGPEDKNVCLVSTHMRFLDSPNPWGQKVGGSQALDGGLVVNGDSVQFLQMKRPGGDGGDGSTTV